MYDIDIQLNFELLIKVVVIDTQLICDEGSSDEQDAYFQKVEEKIRIASAANAPYFIVAGHYPVYSVGDIGTTDKLVQKLKPILHKYNVQAYFSGHDHTMQHLTDNYMNTTVHYVVSGAAAYVDDSTAHMNTVPNNSLKFAWKTNEDQFNCSWCADERCNMCTGALVLVKATKQNMTFIYLNTHGETIYSDLTLYPKNSADNKLSINGLFNYLVVVVLFYFKKYFNKL